MLPLFSTVFHEILFILAGNDDMHGSSKEFEIRQNQTTECGVSCPLAFEKKSPYTYRDTNRHLRCLGGASMVSRVNTMITWLVY